MMIQNFCFNFNETSIACKFKWVWNQIEKNLRQPLWIHAYHQFFISWLLMIFSYLYTYIDSKLICFILLDIDNFLNIFFQIKILYIFSKFALLYLCKIQDVLHKKIKHALTRLLNFNRLTILMKYFL